MFTTYDKRFTRIVCCRECLIQRNFHVALITCRHTYQCIVLHGTHVKELIYKAFAVVRSHIAANREVYHGTFSCLGSVLQYIIHSVCYHGIVKRACGNSDIGIVCDTIVWVCSFNSACRFFCIIISNGVCDKSFIAACHCTKCVCTMVCSGIIGLEVLDVCIVVETCGDRIAGGRTDTAGSKEFYARGAVFIAEIDMVRVHTHVHDTCDYSFACVCLFQIFTGMNFVYSGSLASKIIVHVYFSCYLKSIDALEACYAFHVVNGHCHKCKAVTATEYAYAFVFK